MATISKRGTSWFAQVRRKGYPPQHKTFQFKADALAWSRRIEGAIDEGSVVLGSRALKRTTLSAIIERYLAEVTPKKRGAASEVLRLKKLQRDPLCELDLRSLHPQAIAAYRDRRLLVVKPATVRRELALVQHALTIAKREWGYALALNPVKLVRLPTVDDGRTRRLQPGELERLKAALTGTRSDMVGPIFLLAIETALRRAEIVNLEWKHIDLARRTAHVPLTKTGRARTIPLTDGAIAILRQRLSDGGKSERVFPTTGVALRLAWERLRRRAGLADLRFHDLRHEAISRFCELGLTLPEVALISGHRDYRMLARYTHLQPMDLAIKLRGRAWEAEASLR